jgi:hypothetical protein
VAATAPCGEARRWRLLSEAAGPVLALQMADLSRAVHSVGDAVANKTCFPSGTAATRPEGDAATVVEEEWQPTCTECGGEMQIIEALPKAPRPSAPRIDTS